MVKKSFICILFSLFVFFLQASAFAEKETEKKNESLVDKKQEDSKSKSKKSLKEFIPSEEVSIDKPVAFPVDI